MTDEQIWQAPGQSAAAAAPHWGGYAPPPGGPAWTPPPKPGLVPLRPLGFGTLLFAPFQVLRRNPKATFGSALIIVGAFSFLTFVVTGLASWLAFSRIDSASSDDEAVVTAGSIAFIVLSVLVSLAVSLVGSAFLQGLVVLEAARATLGEKLTLGQVWRATLPRLWALTRWILLISGAITVPLVLVTGGVVALIVLGGTVGLVVGIVVAVAAFLLLVVAGAWLGTKLSIVPSVIVLENSSVRVAIVRSWRLTDGFFWRTLGAEFLVATILGFATQIVSAPISFLLPMVGFIVDPNSTGAGIGVLIALYVLSIAVSVVLGAVTSVVQSALVALIYIDLRMRKEGLDLDLARFVEDRQAGRATVSDPYSVQRFSGPSPA